MVPGGVGGGPPRGSLVRSARVGAWWPAWGCCAGRPLRGDGGSPPGGWWSRRRGWGVVARLGPSAPPPWPRSGGPGPLARLPLCGPLGRSPGAVEERRKRGLDIGNRLWYADGAGSDGKRSDARKVNSHGIPRAGPSRSALFIQSLPGGVLQDLMLSASAWGFVVSRQGPQGSSRGPRGPYIRPRDTAPWVRHGRRWAGPPTQ